MTIKDILKLVLKELKDKSFNEYPSICSVLDTLSENDMITLSEKSIVKKYILNNRPKKGQYYKHYDPHSKSSSWFWERFDLTPRISFIEDLIKRTPHSFVYSLKDDNIY